MKKAKYRAMSEADRNKLAGANAQDFREFKAKMISHQRKFGLIYTPCRGGPVAFIRFLLPGELGRKLANQAFEHDKPDGDLLDDLLKELLKGTSCDVADVRGKLGKIEFNMSGVKEAFQEFKQDGYSYRFTRGPGYSYRRVKYPVVFAGKETELHGQLDDNGILPTELALNKVVRVTGLSHGKLQNADFVGYKRRRGLVGDELEVIAVEVKKDNKIGSVMTAVAQATSYKTLVHKAYIACPSLTSEEYHDPDGLEDVLNLCKENGIGIISIALTDKLNQVTGVKVVLEADPQNVHDVDGLTIIIERQFGLTTCPACRHWVTPTEDTKDTGDTEDAPEDCGWKDKSGDCMRVKLQRLTATTTASS